MSLRVRKNNNLGLRPGPTQIRLCSQMARGLKFRIWKEELHYPWSENKSADQLQLLHSI